MLYELSNLFVLALKCDDGTTATALVYKWNEAVNRVQKVFDNMTDKASMSQPEPRWIPVSEMLPNCNGCYLVWRPHFFGGEIGMPSICYFDGQNTWHDSYGVDFERVLSSDDVTAWMPLPEPYKEANDVTLH